MGQDSPGVRALEAPTKRRVTNPRLSICRGQTRRGWAPEGRGGAARASHSGLQGRRPTLPGILGSLLPGPRCPLSSSHRKWAGGLSSALLGGGAGRKWHLASVEMGRAGDANMGSRSSPGSGSPRVRIPRTSACTWKSVPGGCGGRRAGWLRIGAEKRGQHLLGSGQHPAGDRAGQRPPQTWRCSLPGGQPPCAGSTWHMSHVLGSCCPGSSAGPLASSTLCARPSSAPAWASADQSLSTSLSCWPRESPAGAGPKAPEGWPHTQGRS